MHFKLLGDLDRHARNQKLIDDLKRLDWRGRVKVQLYRFNHILLAAIIGSLLIWALLIAATVRAFSDELHIPCPTQEKCKVLFLTEAEEAGLVGPNRVLDTAAQGRALELGQFAVYMKQKISSAPAGEVKKPEPAPEQK
jgi:hypothetical protein